jgi:hypothetical protein
VRAPVSAAKKIDKLQKQPPIILEQDAVKDEKIMPQKNIRLPCSLSSFQI